MSLGLQKQIRNIIVIAGMEKKFQDIWKKSNIAAYLRTTRHVSAPVIHESKFIKFYPFNMHNFIVYQLHVNKLFKKHEQLESRSHPPSTPPLEDWPWF